MPRFMGNGYSSLTFYSPVEFQLLCAFSFSSLGLDKITWYREKRTLKKYNFRVFCQLFLLPLFSHIHCLFYLPVMLSFALSLHTREVTLEISSST